MGGVKKGPWSTGEDAVLREYVRRHGEGNWNSVMKKTGLMRCGKSCRLRWSNHLRPNLKKGSFSPHEESLIVLLHSKLGNKWSRMASQLPGRTDNEIKNYWNTRMKRRQRAGLPLYPQEIIQNQSYQNMFMHTSSDSSSPSSSSSSSSSSFSSISSSRPPKRPFLDHYFPSRITDSSFSYQMFGLYGSNDDNDCYNTTGFGFSLPLSTSSSSSDLRDPNLLQKFISEKSNANKDDSDNTDVMSYISLLMGEETGGLDILELPSNQTPTLSLTTCNIILDDNIEIDPMPRGNSGLLDALLEESRALSRGRVSKEDTFSSSLLEKEKNVDDDQEEDAENLSDHISSSIQSPPYYSRTNPNNSKHEERTMMGDDDLLMSLLNNFPSSTPLPDWNHTTGNRSNGSDFTSPGHTLL